MATLQAVRLLNVKGLRLLADPGALQRFLVSVNRLVKRALGRMRTLFWGKQDDFDN
jgi:hypothetical protein